MEWLALLASPSVDGVDAHEGDAEVAQAVQQPMQLGLVGELPVSELSAGPRLELRRSKQLASCSPKRPRTPTRDAVAR
jgi:hypothetical protein